MRTLIKASAAVLLLTGILFSCKKDYSLQHGNLVADLDRQLSASIYLTDHQTPMLDSVFIDIRSLEIKLEDDSLPNDGWVTLTINPGVYNILRLRNGIDTLFGTGPLPNGHIKKIRLTLGDNNYAMKDGQTFELNVHDNEFQVTVDLFESNFEITDSGQLLFWIDFDLANSIKIDNSGHGNNNGFKLEPHLHVFTKHKSGSIEGRVLPSEANAVVMAINGTDTAMAIPEDSEGEFKILGLAAGNYTVLIDGNNGYIDSTISNVAVLNNEDTHLGVITLHK
jgi:uncharacterized protein DUF4382